MWIQGTRNVWLNRLITSTSISKCDVDVCILDVEQYPFTNHFYLYVHYTSIFRISFFEYVNIDAEEFDFMYCGALINNDSIIKFQPSDL